MNVTQAKQLRMKDVLAALGCQPHHEAKGEIWYPSPFREESEPSFKINLDRNIWYDFGEGKGGNILDFAMKYYATDLRGALQQLARLNLGTLLEPVTKAVTISKKPAVKAVSVEAELIINKIQPLQNQALLLYLKKRGIPLEIAVPHLQEIYYRRGDKSYFALAFPNDSGGYELRNPYFKGTYGVKDITLLKKEQTAPHLVVFEGFMDMLSVSYVYANELADKTLLTLNSVALKERALTAIREMQATSVYLFLDRDASGRELVSYFREQLPAIEIVDESGRYAGHKDVNAWLEAQQGRGR